MKWDDHNITAFSATRVAGHQLRVWCEGGYHRAFFAGEETTLIVSNMEEARCEALNLAWDRLTTWMEELEGME